MTDWGAHHNDIARWAIGLEGPIGVEAKVLAEPIPGGYTAISDYEVRFTYTNGVVQTVRSTRADNLFDCVRSRKLPVADVEAGHRSACISNLGAIALRAGLRLEWDPALEKFVGTNSKAANRYVARVMRKPYDYGFS